MPVRHNANVRHEISGVNMSFWSPEIISTLFCILPVSANPLPGVKDGPRPVLADVILQKTPASKPIAERKV